MNIKIRPIFLVIMILLTTMTVLLNQFPIHDVKASYSKNEEVDWWTSFHHDIYNTGNSSSSGPNTNHILWRYNTVVESSPVVWDNKVYFGGINGNVYCLNMFNGRNIWIEHIGGNIVSAPAIDNERLFTGGSAMCCLNVYTGELIWKNNIGDWIHSSPLVYNEKVYFGSNDHNFYCLSADNGSEIWTYKTGQHIWSSPAVWDDKVYFGSYDRVVYCLSATNGSLIWKYETGSNIFCSPSIKEGKVYIGSDDGNMYCFSADEGNILWNYSIGKYVDIRSTPAISNGRIYFGANDDNVYCLDSQNGSKIWNTTSLGGFETYVTSSPAISQGKLYVGSWNGNINCLDESNGSLIWTHDTGNNWIKSSPAINKNKIYVGTCENGGKFYCFGTVDESQLIVDIGGPFQKNNAVPITFHPIISGGKGPYQYYWDFGDGNTSEETNPKHMYNITGTYTITLTVTDANGLTDTDTDQVTVTWGGYPDIEIGEINYNNYGFTAQIINNGRKTAHDIDWIINVYPKEIWSPGGLIPLGLVILGEKATGKIEELKPGESKRIQTNPLFGIGKISGEIKVERVNKYTGNLFLFGPLVFCV